MNIHKLSDSIREDIIKSKYDDEDQDEDGFDAESEEWLKSLSVEEAFEAFCQWNGLIGWSGRLLTVVKNLQEAAKP